MACVADRPMNFSDLQKGMRAQIARITHSDDNTNRLQEMGLTVGTEFSVVKVAPFGDPVEIQVRGYRLCLRKNETQNFEVVLLD